MNRTDFELRKIQKLYEVNKLTLNIYETQGPFFNKMSNINNANTTFDGFPISTKKICQIFKHAA